MKKILSILLIASTVTLFSCKKKDPISYPLVGVWKGFYGINNNQPSIALSIAFNSDGTVLTQSQYDTSINRTGLLTTLLGSGTYNPPSGSSVTLTYGFTGTRFTTFFNFISNNYSSQSNRMDGTFGNNGSNTNVGNFYVIKQ